MRRFAALLLVAFAAPLSAADPIWALQQAIADRVAAIESSDAVAAAAIPDATGEPSVTSLPCQCGERCECDPCECPDCPHGGRLCLGSQPWCPACPAAERAARDSGVAVEIVKGDAASALAKRAGAAAYPFWCVVRGDAVTNVWVGQSNAAGVRIMHGVAARNEVPVSRPVESVTRGTHDAQPHEAANPVALPVRYERGIALAPGETLVAIDGVPVSQAERQEAYTEPVPAQTHHEVPAGYHSHRCRNCGHSWTHHDSNAGNAAAHRCINCGAYEYTKSAVGGVAYRSGGCPGGACGTRSRGLFGLGLFR